MGTKKALFVYEYVSELDHFECDKSRDNSQRLISQTADVAQLEVDSQFRVQQ